jgi:hypothetical protein
VEVLFEETVGDWVDFVWPVGVDAGVVLEMAAGGILGYVCSLIMEVFGVAEAGGRATRASWWAWGDGVVFDFNFLECLESLDGVSASALIVGE